MEFEDLDERLEWECKRVIAAFEVSEIEDIFSADEEGTQIIYIGQSGSKKVHWGIDTATNTTDYFKVEDEVFYAMLFACSSAGQEWSLSVYPECHHALMRGLYCMGFKDEGVLAELNAPLTAHEKLELRLWMPREFWPQKWLDEEQEGKTETL